MGVMKKRQFPQGLRGLAILHDIPQGKSILSLILRCLC